MRLHNWVSRLPYNLYWWLYYSASLHGSFIQAQSYWQKPSKWKSSLPLLSDFHSLLLKKSLLNNSSWDLGMALLYYYYSLALSLAHEGTFHLTTIELNVQNVRVFTELQPCVPGMFQCLFLLMEQKNVDYVWTAYGATDEFVRIVIMKAIRQFAHVSWRNKLHVTRAFFLVDSFYALPKLQRTFFSHPWNDSNLSRNFPSNFFGWIEKKT